MLIETLKSLFDRDLHKLQLEIESYQNESQIWAIDKNISNSAGNLTLHLMGNINHFIGNQIGQTGYIRNRELEFSAKNIPQSALINSIKETILVVDQSLDKLSIADLDKIYPLVVFEKEMTTEFFLVHLSTHLAYHLGQINYHRRLLDC